MEYGSSSSTSDLGVCLSMIVGDDAEPITDPFIDVCLKILYSIIEDLSARCLPTARSR